MVFRNINEVGEESRFNQHLIPDQILCLLRNVRDKAITRFQDIDDGSCFFRGFIDESAARIDDHDIAVNGQCNRKDERKDDDQLCPESYENSPDVIRLLIDNIGLDSSV